MTNFVRVAELVEDWTPTRPTHDPWWRGRKWPPNHDPFWTGYFCLLSCNWFRRHWTFHKVVLTHQSITLCGSHHVDTDDLLKFVRNGTTEGHNSYIPHTSVAVSRVPGQLEVKDLAYMACCVIREYRVERFASQMDAAVHCDQEVGLPLTHGIKAALILCLVHELRNRHVLEPVDRVRAIIGILDEAIQIQLSPFVDYNDQSRVEYWDTYIRFVKVIIGSSLDSEVSSSLASNLQLLGIPQSVERCKDDLSSWCPDLLELAVCNMFLTGIWNLPVTSETSWKQSLLCSESDKGGHALNVFVLQNHPLKLISTSPYEKLLCIRGFIVDTISEVVEDVSLSGAESNRLETDLRRTLKHPLHMSVVNVHIKTLDIARCVYSSFDDEMLDIPPEFLMCFLMDQHVATTTATAYRAALDKLQSKMRTEFNDLDQDLCSNGMACMSWLLSTTGHSFFSTTGGRFGVSHPGIKPGDKICAFYGGEHLYILRWPDNPTMSGSRYNNEHAEFCSVAYMPYLMTQHERDMARQGSDEIFVMK